MLLGFYQAELNAVVGGAGNLLSKDPPQPPTLRVLAQAQHPECWSSAHPLSLLQGLVLTWPGVFPVCHRAFRRCSPGPVVEFTTFTERPEYP